MTRTGLVSGLIGAAVASTIAFVAMSNATVAPMVETDSGIGAFK